MALKQILSSYKSFENELKKKKRLRNFWTAVNRSEMEEIKSVKLRENLKIHQQQTEHMVTSTQ